MDLEAKIADLSFSEVLDFCVNLFLEIFSKNICFFNLNYFTCARRKFLKFRLTHVCEIIQIEKYVF